MQSNGKCGTVSAVRTNTTLIADLSEGDKEKWRLFVDHYRPAIVGFSIKQGLQADEAENALQETWISFFQAMQAGRYNRESGRLRKWLFGFVRNKVLEALRKRPPISQFPGVTDSTNGPLDPVDPGNPWDDLWRQELLQMCLDDCRKKFGARTVQIYELYVLQELPAREVAERFEVTVNAVYLVKHRVEARIRETLEPAEDYS